MGVNSTRMVRWSILWNAPRFGKKQVWKSSRKIQSPNSNKDSSHNCRMQWGLFGLIYRQSKFWIHFNSERELDTVKWSDWLRSAPVDLLGCSFAFVRFRPKGADPIHQWGIKGLVLPLNLTYKTYLSFMINVSSMQKPPLFQYQSFRHSWLLELSFVFTGLHSMQKLSKSQVITLCVPWQENSISF